MGDPNATEIPAAAAAESISRFRASNGKCSFNRLSLNGNHLHCHSRLEKTSLEDWHNSMRHVPMVLLFRAIDQMLQRGTRCWISIA